MRRAAVVLLAVSALARDAGAQSFGRPVEPGYVGNWFYVDHGAGGAVVDWNCSWSSYDGHGGTDYSMAGGHSQDEGIPITAALAGTVDRAVDGYFDGCGGCTGSGDCSAGAANYVTVAHGDLEYYFHLRTWSLAVSVGDAVVCGTKVGEMGSSGCSTGTHLHFEPRRGDRVTWLEPYEGACGAASTMWIDQGPWRGMPGGCDPLAGYHGTLVSISAPGTMYSGDRTAVVIEVLNDGTRAWDGSVYLAGSGDLVDSTWDAVDRPATVSGAVAPGQTARFDFLVEAPPVEEDTAATDFFAMAVEGLGAFPPTDVVLDVLVLPTPDSIADDDADGFVRQEDCDDSSAEIHPLAPDACDGIDQDCDGLDCDEEDGTSPDEDGRVGIEGGCACGAVPGAGDLGALGFAALFWKRRR